MISALLGLAASMLVVWTALLSARGAGRVLELPVKAPRGHATRNLQSFVVLQRIGQWVTDLPGLKNLPVTAPVQRAVGISLIFCPPIAVRWPLLSVLMAIVFVTLPWSKQRREQARRLHAIERDMPVVVDLLNLGVKSGLTVGAALAYVAERIEGPISDVYRTGLAQLAQGRRLADVLVDCEGQLGDSALSLTSALLSAERYGSPVGASLAQLAQETRLDQQRRGEKAARRLSVQLLFPVAGCIFPAFVLLTAAPLLAGSIGTLAHSFH